MSHGAAPFVMTHGCAALFTPFVDPVDRFLNGVQPEAGSRALAATLADPRIHSITTDDRTLVIAHWGRSAGEWARQRSRTPTDGAVTFSSHSPGRFPQPTGGRSIVDWVINVDTHAERKARLHVLHARGEMLATSLGGAGYTPEVQALAEQTLPEEEDEPRALNHPESSSGPQ